ncbi:hypothetical protein EhV145_00179 [Emiliania huxleyi virus 145]|nr:hypothetical protein EhV145_00179 [Emiliania huxleyi virus 145]
MKVYTINGDAHTLANIVSSELMFNNKDASYRVPHPNSRTSQLVLHDGCSNKDLESTCTNLQGILSEMRHELAVKFADDLIHTDEKSLIHWIFHIKQQTHQLLQTVIFVNFL